MMVNGAVQDVEQPRRREPEDTTNKVLLSVEEPGTKKSDTRPLETTPRSSSPAKRSASDMEGGAADTNLSSSPPPQPSQLNGSINLPTDDACSPSSPTTPLPDTRTTRSNSVDMMSGEDVLQVSGRGGHYLEMKPDTKKTMLMTVMASKTTNSADRPPAEDQITLLDDQVRIVMELSSKEFVEGQKLYIVSGSWLGRVFARTSEAQTYSSYGKEGIEGDIGPVDNTSVVADDPDYEHIKTLDGEVYIPLKPGLQMGEDFEVLPEEAWNEIMKWYGLAKYSVTIVRFARNTSPEGALSENIQCELYPPVFTVRRIADGKTGTDTVASTKEKDKAPRLVASRTEPVQVFVKRIKQSTGIHMERKVRIWRMLEVQPGAGEPVEKSGIITPATSRSASPMPSAKHIVPLSINRKVFFATEDGSRRELVDIKDQTMSTELENVIKLDTIGLAANQTLILEEEVFENGVYHFFSDTDAATIPRLSTSVHVASGSKTAQSKQTSTAGLVGGRNSPNSSSIMTRGRTRKNGRARGTVGLTNLGNTCYMNSALQCIRSVEELSFYFLRHEHLKDLNPSNPLGYRGAIAKAYAGLLSNLYTEKSISSFAPDHFKVTLGRNQPMFSGYGQQDSQEFLSFLVDGLHEDLNRVKQKPYTENPESDDNMINDPEAIRTLAEQYRANYKARNDSVAMDLFNGFYKNTMVCPVCDKVSITFDPFSLLTLQLPVENNFQHTIVFAPLNIPPFNIDIDIDRTSTVRALKQYVAKRFPGLTWHRIMAAEVYTHKFYKFLDNDQTLLELNIQPRDSIVLYELEDDPTNYPKPLKVSKYRMPAPLPYYDAVSSEEDLSEEEERRRTERMLVPIFHQMKTRDSYRPRDNYLRLWPSFIIVEREEAEDYDAILRKVLNKVSTMTTQDILTETYGPYTSSASKSDEDVVVTTDEDASSNLDNTVRAGSVEGDDSVVDVSMLGTPNSQPDQNEDKARNENGDFRRKSRRKVLKPGDFIPPECRRLFDLQYLRKCSEAVPTGWPSFNTYKDYLPISTRIQFTTTRRSSGQSDLSQQSKSSASDDNGNALQHSSAPKQRDFIESSSEEDSTPANQYLQSGRHNTLNVDARVTNKKLTTHRKSNHSTKKAVLPPSGEKPMLIRLGEGLILEWEPEGYDALFGATDDDESRGKDTWASMPKLPDPEVDLKKAKRVARKRTGVSLDDCFAETAKAETLSEENAWYCNRCKELRRASKQLEIWTAPDILVIHLKRFSSSRTFRDKVDVMIDFPTEGLDLTDRVALKEEKSLMYDLFAVDNHYGGLGGGHYTAFAQNFYDKKWYEYNDSSVTQRKVHAVVTSAAYLLFYRRRSDSPVGPEYLRQLVLDARQQESASQHSSAAQSPAGDGRRLGGSFHNGSLEAFPEAGAALPAPDGGLRGATPTTSKPNKSYRPRADSGVDEAGYDMDQTLNTNPEPPHNSFFDEGVDVELDTSYDGYATSSGRAVVSDGGMSALASYHDPTWNFQAVDMDATSEGAVFDDAATNVAAPGSNMSDDLHDRLMTDFGDELHDSSTKRSCSPAFASSRDDTPMLPDEEGPINLKRPVDESEEELVAAVRVDEHDMGVESDAEKQGLSHRIEQ